MESLENPMYTVLEFAPDVGPSGLIKEFPKKSYELFVWNIFKSI